jgi:hypothetical protein
MLKNILLSLIPLFVVVDNINLLRIFNLNAVSVVFITAITSGKYLTFGLDCAIIFGV